MAVVTTSGARITGWGTAMPDKVVTNVDLEGSLDTSDQWIVERTGIRERRVGGSTTGHRLGVNAQMAHQEAVDEFQKLADSLRTYSDAIKLWADEVRDVDGSTNAEMTMRAAALAQVTDHIDQARDQSSSTTMGDGQYTETPAAGDGA